MLNPLLGEARTVTSTRTLRPYDRYGVQDPSMEWLPLSGQFGGAHECFLIRFNPGAASRPHEHTGREEFLVLEGELEDCDGAVFRAGDFVSYREGTRHYSVSASGCLLLVLVTGGSNRLLAEADAEDLTAAPGGG